MGLPEQEGEISADRKRPSRMYKNYQKDVTSYTKGRGRLTCVFHGYGPCHNEEDVLKANDYVSGGDLAYPSSSVFCYHGQEPSFHGMKYRNICIWKCADRRGRPQGR